MASKSFILESLMDACGKDSPQVRHELDQKIGEITIELLTQNDGRFFGLKKTQTISVLTTTRRYKLNSDFHTIGVGSAEVDSEGNYLQDLNVLSKTNIRHRIRDSATYDYHYGYIEKLENGPSGRGYYLVLAIAPAIARTLEIEYYRRPTENDTDVMTDYAIIKRGVRAQFASLFPDDYEADRVIYLNRLPKFVEKTRRVITDESILPPRRVQKRNRAMHRYGNPGIVR